VKTVGLLGEMSWESSIEYERIINQGVRARLGGTASADLLIRSYNFAAIEELQAQGDWDAAGALLAADAQRLVVAGADVIVLCKTTMHVVADRIEAAIDVPFIHLADTTAEAVAAAGLTTLGLLGSRYTMEQDFYRGRLEGHGLTALIPDEPDRTMVHDVIYNELVRWVVTDDVGVHYFSTTRLHAEAAIAAALADEE
jgi:aspartate racemase